MLARLLLLDIEGREYRKDQAGAAAKVSRQWKEQLLCESEIGNATK